MEASVIKVGRAKQVHRDVAFCSNLSHRILSRNSKICFGQSIRWKKKFPMRLTIKATSQSDPIVADKVFPAKSEPIGAVRLYVGLPLDAVSDCNTVNHARAISAGLRALKLLGVEGVELPVWWGVAEKVAQGKYDWSGYLALVEMIETAGLKLRVSLCFHSSKEARIPLPDWVSSIGESEPSIFFTDRSGQRYRDCLSLGVDDLPVLDGKTPIQVYGEFCLNFKSSFSHFLGSTITGISIGLGPDGELRYPSHHHPPRNDRHLGVGEFQCYDKYMLNNLKLHAEASGNPLWGLSGPHDAPNYDHTPSANSFAKEHGGGSWESQYGDFFLSWYSNQLRSRGDRLLSLAASVFSDTTIEVSGKLPLVHPWYKTRSHPYELTSGFYNTVNRDGYEAIVETFARNSCEMILPGMDLTDERQPKETMSSPESLLAQITAACKKHRVKVSGQNSSAHGAPNTFEQIKKNLSDVRMGVDLFTYQRMGAYFFSPEHFPLFMKFVRCLNQPELRSDDLPSDGVDVAESLHEQPGNNLQMQAA